MMQNKKIAVTGGIGSGKTQLCMALKELGYPVFSCDEISDDLWKDEGYLAGLSALFPACVREGIPRKDLISKLVFSDKEALKKLNVYAHPRIMDALLERMKGEKVAFAEVPLLFEGGYEDLFDAVLIVTRGEDARVRAVAARDGLSVEEIHARMRAQGPYPKEDGGKFVLVKNDGSKDELLAAARDALKKLGL